MKQFASKLSPYLKPFIKKLTTTYIKKQLTTEDNMNEKQNTSQLTFLLDKENPKTESEKQLKQILDRALKPKKCLSNFSLPILEKQESEKLESGLIVGSLREPSYLDFLLKIKEQQQQPINNISSFKINKKWRQHVKKLQNLGYDSNFNIYASNFKFDNENKERKR